MNGGFGFVCNFPEMGMDGEEWRNSFGNGEQGGGGVSLRSPPERAQKRRGDWLCPRNARRAAKEGKVMDLDRVFQLARQREAEEAAKPLEQRRQEYRKKNEKAWAASEEGRLCQEFYRAYTGYRDFLKEHSRGWREGNGNPLDFTEHQAYEALAKALGEYQQEREETDRRNLQRAKLAARCTHRRLNGKTCGSPRMRG